MYEEYKVNRDTLYSAYTKQVEESGNVLTNPNTSAAQGLEFGIGALPSSYPLSYFTGNRTRENPAVTTCFDLQYMIYIEVYSMYFTSN